MNRTPPGRADRNGNGPDSRTPQLKAIAFGLRRIVKALHLYSREVRGEYGLTGPQLWALKTLTREGPLTVGRLADALAVNQSSVSILLDRLESRSLVNRVRSPDDRRVVRVELTKRGSAMAAAAPEAAQGRLLHALNNMPARDLARIRKSVNQLVAAMEADDVDARFFFSDQ